MILTLIAVLLSALPVQTPRAANSGSIEGTVCEVGTCKPIPGIRLVLFPGANQPLTVRKATVTDLAGTFRFRDLPDGVYPLQVEGDNYAVASTLSSITVAGGAEIKGLKIEMRPLGTISGRAFDDRGNPLAGARVDAMAFQTQSIFHLVLTPVSFAETNDRGEFRIPGLQPDEYYVRISPLYNRHIENSYPMTYYPNTTDPANAAKLAITGGNEIAGIETQVPRGVKVRGRLVQSGNEKVQAWVYLMLRRPSVFVVPYIGPNFADQTTDDFEIRGVVPGSYYLYAITENKAPDRSPSWIRLPLEVGDKDVENLTLPLIPAGKVKGRITVAADATNAGGLDLSRIRLSLSTTEMVPFNASFGPQANVVGADVDKNGEFRFEHLSEMLLFLPFQIFNDTWFIASARFDGSDILTTGFSTTPGKESVLEVVLSNASGSFAGVIKDRNDNPVPAGRVALLPEVSRRTNPLQVRTGVAVEKGEFLVENLAPGEYVAIALPDEDEFTPAFLRDLQSVEKYEQFGQHVHIGARETTRLDLTVAPTTKK